ncbi:4-hydroxyphenylacetate 3-monooxygenase, oxygenase component [Evansella cellulosilytica]|uniref:4-hydroxyphenylacetate 3-monooxygenase, oxygenase subunit n=1 Tax=Evansella cellulosilytica (strain ATCC 21833 / DSM 2522 / FERM P-1141 / JCM 9156 / N-4) TaxID=649639 RepID=E6U0W0_EVAC2|nr:4-hydroxyphenylacetate 3-monooxygenase, oxygenase component [Evansella cellulosilytica]ADU30272.1 4-hydroxyphenylacetate 3-monooxygenase, oxygenase subunit [Evansella cellulosilytica DSM 2522]
MSIITGQQYIKRINKMKNEIWIEGKRIDGDVSEQRAFKGVLKSKASLYDMQHHEPTKSYLTRYSEVHGETINFAFEKPTSIDDLKKRREATQLWARKSCGTIGRSPDYINTAIMTLASSLPFFEEKYTENITAIYENAVKNDLSFTHTFINPQVNRSPYSQINLLDSNQDKIIAAKIVDETSDGIVIQGARLLATQGGVTDELLVLPSGGDAINNDYAYAFSIPSNTPGLKFICREPFSKHPTNTFDHPLSAQFDEIDSVVVFDHVLVPWERVFLYKDLHAVGSIYTKTSLNLMLLFQATSRQVVKTEFILGLAESIAETISITEYQHVQEKISEIIVTLEIMKALLQKSEMSAIKNEFGMMVPNPLSLMTASNYYQKIYPRLIEILHLLGASGFITLPTESDFNSSISSDLELYLQAKNADAKDRVQLFRLAWDLTMSSFGTRQTQYERFFFGDPVRLSSSLYQAYNKKPYVDDIQAFLNNQ